VQRHRPVRVEWDFFSLRMQNYKPGENDDWWEKTADSHVGFRIMALFRKKYDAEQANDLTGKMYLELGEANFERKERIDDPAVLKAALTKLGVPESLYEEALADDSTIETYKLSHQEAVSKGSFGVPALIFPGGEKTTFGPVIGEVPQGEEAVKLWDATAFFMQMPYLYELKKSR
jgi:predicted DsbA family dithiol-disulfide isomerase